MAAEFLRLRAIDKNATNWSAKTQILAKMNPRVGFNSPTTYQKLLLGDEMGDCMEAVIFNGDIDLFQHTLQVGESYVITNAAVNLTNERFKNPLSMCDYQMTISARTSVVDAENDGTSFSLPAPELFDRDAFLNEIGKGSKISTVCVIIAKRQGQTLERASIYLPEPVFSHGQLYVAFSRVRNSDAIKVLIWPPTVDSTVRCETRNVVYKEILEDSTHVPLI